MGELIKLFEESKMMKYAEMELNECRPPKISESDYDRIEKELIRYVDELKLAM